MVQRGSEKGLFRRILGQNHEYFRAFQTQLIISISHTAEVEINITLDEVSRLGGQLTLNQSFMDRMLMTVDGRISAVMLLSLPTSRELKN